MSSFVPFVMQHLPWIAGAVVAVAVLTALAVWGLMRRPVAAKPLPTEWTLSPRPVFSTDERRVYRQLREALPHHVILSKLPLVRFCQPNDPEEVRYWYDLLGAIHVTFAICSANGRVLAVIDLDNDRGGSRRVMQIKQSVLGACRVRYLRCPVDHLPSVPGVAVAGAAQHVDARAAAGAGAQRAPGARHADQHRGQPARRTYGVVAGLVAVPGLVLRTRHPRRCVHAERVRVAARHVRIQALPTAAASRTPTAAAKPARPPGRLTTLPAWSSIRRATARRHATEPEQPACMRG